MSKTKTTSEQLNFRLVDRKTTKQEKCKHKWVNIQELDHETDSVYDRVICRVCGLTMD